MTTPSDAVKVMRHVAACHHRTAPRLDDKEAVMATASIWARIFDRHKLELPDLLAAVERRAENEATAPEPAEIVTLARQIRRDRASREQAVPELRAAHEAKIDRRIADFAGGFGLKLDGPRRELPGGAA